jgi:hypothetical protein
VLGAARVGQVPREVEDEDEAHLASKEMAREAVCAFCFIFRVLTSRFDGKHLARDFIEESAYV